MLFIRYTFSYICVNIIQLNKIYRETDIQILIATMNRTNLDFLRIMFGNCEVESLSILIVNQTSPEKLLKSDFDNIKIINSFEVGLSKSRNLSLEKASKDIVVICDDDVVYKHDFISMILFSFNNYKSSIHCFQTETDEGILYSNYPKKIKKLNYRSIRKVLSIEVSFLRKEIKSKNCFYNELFGLGAKFEDSETFFFLRNCMYKSVDVVFFPFTIVEHKSFSSSDDINSDRLLYAKMGGFCKVYGYLSYFFLIKFIFFLVRKKKIPFKSFFYKFKVGSKGIIDYKMILKNNLDKKYE